MRLADLVRRVLGPDVPISVRAYDGSESSPPGAIATLILRRPEALQRFVTAPGELGLGRAYVAGDIDVEGDLFGSLTAIADHLPKPDARLVADIIRMLGPSRLKPLPPPPEEVRLHGLRHSKGRDAQAIAHHYDVSNEFYRLVLGPTMYF